MVTRDYKRKIVTLPDLLAERKQLRSEGKTVAFTNGCFDLLHPGHVDYLDFARRQGDVLVVGLNSDASVRRNKGPTRPLVPEDSRARVLAALEMVTYVTLFDSPEPQPLIAAILPDVLVKGEDWAHYVSGRDIVEANGGRVILAPLLQGFSTTRLVERICKAHTGKEAPSSCDSSSPVQPD